MFARPERPQLTLDMAPLIDVVFQLLIFFMLSSTFVVPNLELSLPEVDSSSGPSQQSALVVSVDRDGMIFLNHEPLGRREIRQRLETRLAKQEDKTVNLRMDGSRPHEEFVRLMKELRDAGARQLQIVYEEAKTGSEK